MTPAAARRRARGRRRRRALWVRGATTDRARAGTSPPLGRRAGRRRRPGASGRRIKCWTCRADDDVHHLFDDAAQLAAPPWTKSSISPGGFSAYLVPRFAYVASPVSPLPATRRGAWAAIRLYSRTIDARHGGGWRDDDDPRAVLRARASLFPWRPPPPAPPLAPPPLPPPSIASRPSSLEPPAPVLLLRRRRRRRRSPTPSSARTSARAAGAASGFACPRRPRRRRPSPTLGGYRRVSAGSRAARGGARSPPVLVRFGSRRRPRKRRRSRARLLRRPRRDLRCREGRAWTRAGSSSRRGRWRART